MLSYLGQTRYHDVFFILQMMEVHWKDRKMRESGFFYLFQHFKKFYLPHIFTSWDPADRLYGKSEGKQ